MIAKNYQRQCARSLALICVFLTFSMLFFAQAVFKPIVLAVLMSLVLEKPVQFLSRLRVPRMISAALLLLIVVASFLKVGDLVSSPAMKWAKQLPAVVLELEQSIKSVGQTHDPYETTSDAKSGAFEISSEPIQDVIEDISILEAILAEGPALVYSIAMTILLSYFFLVFGKSLIRESAEFLDQYVGVGSVENISERISEAVSQYLLTLACINLILGIVLSIVLYLFDMPNPLFWGLLGGALNFMPYIGILAGTVAVALVSFYTFPHSIEAFLIPLSFYGVSVIEGSFITPTTLGVRFKINPALILMWLILWAWLWGMVGAVIAFPLFAACKITWQELSAQEFRASTTVPKTSEKPSTAEQSSEILLTS